METDLSGNQISNAAAAKLPDGGKYYYFYLKEPVWNGRRWLVPTSLVKYKRVSQTDAPDSAERIRQDLMMAVAARKADQQVKLKLRKVISNSENTEEWFNHYVLSLPTTNNDAGSAAQNETAYLFVSAYSTIPREQRKLESYRFRYFTIPINWRGRKSGKIIDADIPPWSHSIKYDPDKPLSSSSEHFSLQILHDEENFIIAQARFLTRRIRNSASGYDSELEFNLLSINPNRGKAEVLAQKKQKLGYYSVLNSPLICWFSSRIAVINEEVFRKNLDESNQWMNYFYRFKPW